MLLGMSKEFEFYCGLALHIALKQKLLSEA